MPAAATAHRPSAPIELEDDPSAEFDRQLAILIAKGYPKLAGMSKARFVELVEPLRTAAVRASATEPGRIPFVLVVTRDLVRTEDAVAQIDVRGKAGWTDETPEDHAAFVPIKEVVLPDAAAYLLEDVDAGTDSLGLKPNDVLPTVLAAGRTPLTMDEGVALITLFPNILRSHNAYQLMGSRCGDKRVTAVWMSKGAPRLGWCWAGNHHTWLGMASAHRRLAA